MLQTTYSPCPLCVCEICVPPTLILIWLTSYPRSSVWMSLRNKIHHCVKKIQHIWAAAFVLCVICFKCIQIYYCKNVIVTSSVVCNSHSVARECKSRYVGVHGTYQFWISSVVTHLFDRLWNYALSVGITITEGVCTRLFDIYI